MNFFAIALLSAITASPAPQPADPLKTIVTETSKPVCSTLLKVVAPAVEGLRVNDAEFEHSDALFIRAARDAFMGSGRFDIDMMNLGTEENVIAQNVIRIDTLLADTRLDHAATGDDRLLKETKAHLEAALAYQKEELNFLSGTAETEALQSLMTRGDPLQGAEDPEGTGRTPPTPSFSILGFGQPPAVAAAATDMFPEGNPTEIGAALHGMPVFAMKNGYFGMARAIAFDQWRERTPEYHATAAILTLAKQCR